MNSSGSKHEDVLIKNNALSDMFFSVEEDDKQVSEFEYYRNRLKDLLRSNSYIAKSSYKDIIEEIKNYLKQKLVTRHRT